MIEPDSVRPVSRPVPSQARCNHAVGDPDAMTENSSTQATDGVPTYLERGDPRACSAVTSRVSTHGSSTTPRIGAWASAPGRRTGSSSVRGSRSSGSRVGASGPAATSYCRSSGSTSRSGGTTLRRSRRTSTRTWSAAVPPRAPSRCCPGTARRQERRHGRNGHDHVVDSPD